MLHFSYTVKPLYTNIQYNDKILLERQFEWNDSLAQDGTDN